MSQATPNRGLPERDSTPPDTRVPESPGDEANNGDLSSSLGVLQARQRFRDRLGLLRIYLSPIYVAMLWTNWAVESSSLLSTSSSMKTGWELTEGSALPVLATIVGLSVLQFLVRIPRPRRLLARCAVALFGGLATVTHFLAAVVFLFSTMDPGDELIGLRLFYSLSDYQIGYYVVMTMAWVYLATSVVEAISRVVGKRIMDDPAPRSHGLEASGESDPARHRLEGASAERPNTELVLLIHGTGSASDSDQGDGWWQVGGEAWRSLNGRLPAAIRCHERRQVFHWSGHNSEQARREAGRELRRFLLTLEKSQTPYHIVAHSHGGSIVWHALQHCLGSGRELAFLRSWTTLGTPFLRYRAYRNAWALAAPLLVALGLALGNASWFRAVGHAWRLLLEGGYFPTILLLAAIISATAILIAYNAFRVLRATWAWLSCAHQRRIDRRVFERYGAIWLPLWSQSDEAINGLKGTQQMVVGGASQPLTETANPLLRLMRIVEIPFRLAYQRIVRPIVDEFVWDRLMRTIQGNDLGDHRLQFTSASPLPDHPVPPLDAALEEEVVEVANANCEKSGGLLRSSLGLAASCEYRLSQVGEHLASFLNGKELVHWAYYQVDNVLAQIARHIRSHSHVATSPSCGQLASSSQAPLAEVGAGPGSNNNPHKTNDHSGMRALVIAQLAMLAGIVLVGQTLHMYVVDQFTPQRQIKEVIWQVPSGTRSTASDADVLNEWANQFARTGLIPPEGQQLTDFVGRFDDPTKLTLAMAKSKQGETDFALAVTNQIGDPFFRTTAAILLCASNEEHLQRIELRNGEEIGEESTTDYGESQEQILAAAKSVAAAGSQRALLRSSILVKYERESASGLFALARFMGGRSLHGRELSEAAIQHALAWSGDADAVQAVIQGREQRVGVILSDCSYLEWLLALHPIPEWDQRARATAATMLLDDEPSKVHTVVDVYARYGGWGVLLGIDSEQSLEQLNEAKRHALRRETFRALRRSNMLRLSAAAIASLPENSQQSLRLHRDSERRLQALIRRAVNLKTVSVEATDEEQERDANWSSLNWLTTSERKRLLAEALLEQGRIALARKLAIDLMLQSTGPNNDQWTGSQEARDIGRLLAQCGQFYYARRMYPHLERPGHRLSVDAAIMVAFSEQLASQGNSLRPAYVALFREKDLELGMDRSSTFRYMQKW